MSFCHTCQNEGVEHYMEGSTMASAPCRECSMTCPNCCGDGRVRTPDEPYREPCEVCLGVGTLLTIDGVMKRWTP